MSEPQTQAETQAQQAQTEAPSQAPVERFTVTVKHGVDAEKVIRCVKEHGVHVLHQETVTETFRIKIPVPETPEPSDTTALPYKHQHRLPHPHPHKPSPPATTKLIAILKEIEGVESVEPEKKSGDVEGSEEMEMATTFELEDDVDAQRERLAAQLGGGSRAKAPDSEGSLI